MVAPIVLHHGHRAARAMPPPFLLHQLFKRVAFAGVFAFGVKDGFGAELAPLGHAICGEASEGLGQEVFFSVHELGMGAFWALESY